MSTKILFIGSNETLQAAVMTTCPADVSIENFSFQNFSEKFESLKDGDYALICTSDLCQDSEAMEAAQLVQTQCPKTMHFYATYDPKRFPRKLLLKNGFKEAFLLPMDQGHLADCVGLQFSAEAISRRQMRNVRVLDLDGASTLKFDTYVYLPLNKKYVMVSRKDASLGEGRFQKMKERELSNLFIESKDLEKFYEYTAEKLAGLADNNNTMSATERQVKLQGAVRDLFADLFDESAKADFDRGKEILSSCQKVVSNYITGGKSNWYERLITTIGGNFGSYDHAAQVSTLAALFAIAVNHPKPEDLAIAGFLHDLGLADAVDEFWLSPEDTWTKEQREYYVGHPERSLNVVKNKRMILSSEVINAIAQHHEKFNGTGFPRQVPGNKISRDAQILSVADQFAYLTTEVEGRQRLTPPRALQAISQTGSIDPGLLSQVKKLFPTV